MAPPGNDDDVWFEVRACVCVVCVSARCVARQGQPARCAAALLWVLGMAAQCAAPYRYFPPVSAGL